MLYISAYHLHSGAIVCEWDLAGYPNEVQRRIETMKNGLILLGMIVALVLVPPACADAIIIDHNCTNLSEIPDEWIDATQDHIKLHYAHTSHGGQLTTGLQRIESSDSNYSQARGSSYLPTEADALCIFDGQEHGIHITPEEYWGSEAGRQYTQDVIDHNPTINVSMWSWCCQLTSYSAEQVQTYLDVMEGFETLNPDVRFVYMTCNAQATGSSGYKRYLRNEQIRSWVRDHPEEDRVLFDFADLDSWWYNSTAGAGMAGMATARSTPTRAAGGSTRRSSTPAERRYNPQSITRPKATESTCTTAATQRTYS
jgi:hypothetical protein